MEYITIKLEYNGDFNAVKKFHAFREFFIQIQDGDFG